MAGKFLHTALELRLSKGRSTPISAQEVPPDPYTSEVVCFGLHFPIVNLFQPHFKVLEELLPGDKGQGRKQEGTGASFQTPDWGVG